MKIDKNKLILQLLKNVTEYSDLDDALLNTLSQLKINQSNYYEIKQELVPNGISSLMNELNSLINVELSKEKTNKIQKF